jgi:hypothetical protein
MELAMRSRLPSVALGASLLSIVPFWAVQAEDAHTSAELKTADVRIELRAGSAAPRLVLLAGPAGRAWSNDAEETLPTSVEVNGSTLPISWQFKPELGSIDARKVVFVYESTAPHLLLKWQWEARADFGPVEHRVTIENLSGQEVWLPMVDSLAWIGTQPRQSDLRNFYVEKGADTPSAEGTHLEAVTDGYRWTGKSTTYAHPVPGEKREIIPAEFVYATDGAQSGWYAGIEFSGRTRITLERSGGNSKERAGARSGAGTFSQTIDGG